MPIWVAQMWPRNTLLSARRKAAVLLEAPRARRAAAILFAAISAFRSAGRHPVCNCRRCRRGQCWCRGSAKPEFLAIPREGARRFALSPICVLAEALHTKVSAALGLRAILPCLGTTRRDPICAHRRASAQLLARPRVPIAVQEIYTSGAGRLACGPTVVLFVALRTCLLAALRRGAILPDG